MKNSPAPDKVQGEGDYEAARRYDKSAHDFVEAGKVDEAARKAKPRTIIEEETLRAAERVGRSRSKGEDPAVKQSEPSPVDAPKTR